MSKASITELIKDQQARIARLDNVVATKTAQHEAAKEETERIDKALRDLGFDPKKAEVQVRALAKDVEGRTAELEALLDS